MINYLFIHKFYALFIGRFFDNAEHRHHAVQLCSVLEGEMEISVNNRVLRGSSFLIAPDCPHKVFEGEGELFLLFLDPEITAGKTLTEKYLSTNPWVRIDLSSIFKGIQEPITSEKITALMSSLLRELDVELQQNIDPRILKIIDIIEHSSFKKDRIKALAEEVSLSESRLQCQHRS